MRCSRSPKALPRCHIYAFIPAHSCSQNLFHCIMIHASAFMPPHSRLTYAATFAPPQARHHIYTAAFTPLSLCRIDAVVLTPQQWCCRSDAAAFMQHLARSSIFSLILGANLTLQHSRRRMYAAAHASPHLRCCSRGGALPVEADHS